MVVGWCLMGELGWCLMGELGSLHGWAYRDSERNLPEITQQPVGGLRPETRTLGLGLPSSQSLSPLNTWGGGNLVT